MSPVTTAPSDSRLPVVELSIEGPAHGGHCVARHEGRVVFVRHAVPGERVLAALTQSGDDDSFWRADVVEVIEASPDRVESVWPAASVGGVGGAELAHISLAGQREWKRAVIREQLLRLGGVDVDLAVLEAPGDAERGGLEYRTRAEFVADGAGRLGMHAHRSKKVIPLDDMPLAVPEIRSMGLFDRKWPRGARVSVAWRGPGERPLVFVGGEPWRKDRPDTRPSARRTVREFVTVTVHEQPYEYEFRVAGTGFWQVHREAPALLAQAVVDAVEHFVPGEGKGATILDLYCGAGLFTAPLADVVGDAGLVIGVEQDAKAVRDARRLLASNDTVQLVQLETLQALTSGQMPEQADAVVMDPPRAGAGREVVQAVIARTPQAVVYVACDPAALGRDVKYFADGGYELAALGAWDIFPHTHHVESLAVFLPA